MGLVRLIGLADDVAEARRFSAVLWEFAPFSASAEPPFRSNVRFKGPSSLVFVFGALVDSTSSGSGFAVDSVFDKVGFRVNMSLMLLRLSNSGSNLPDMGSVSLAELNSLCRIPSLNMPGGFKMSSIWLSCPCQSTTSFVDA
jgi:hypothetical protein